MLRIYTSRYKIVLFQLMFAKLHLNSISQFFRKWKLAGLCLFETWPPCSENCLFVWLFRIVPFFRSRWFNVFPAAVSLIQIYPISKPSKSANRGEKLKAGIVFPFVNISPVYWAFLKSYIHIKKRINDLQFSDTEDTNIFIWKINYS